jgi:hypothetical protein
VAGLPEQFKERVELEVFVLKMQGVTEASLALPKSQIFNSSIGLV